MFILRHLCLLLQKKYDTGMLPTSLVGIADRCDKGRAVRHHVYVIKYKKDPQVLNKIPAAFLCLSQYSMHVLIGDINMI